MRRRDIHEKHDFFEYVRLDGGALPPADPARLDVAILDMNHSWPNVGHDAIVHAILEAAEALAVAGMSQQQLGVAVGWTVAVAVYLVLGYMTFLYRWPDDGGTGRGVL